MVRSELTCRQRLKLDNLGVLWTCFYESLATAPASWWQILTLGPTPPWPCVRRVMLEDKSKIFRFIHLMGVHLVGMHLMDVHFMGAHLMDMHLMSVHLMGVHLMGVYLMSMHL
jgi:hypothetical protein